MKTIYLARHAQSESNTGQKISVNDCIAITKLGQTQSVELADWFCANVPSIDEVFVSTYERTHQTANPLLEKLNKKPIILSDLHEFNTLNFANIKNLDFFGIQHLSDHYWQTADGNHIDGNELSVPDNWRAESFYQFVERVKNALKYFQQLPDGTYVVYTHGIWLSMLRFLLLNEKTHHANSLKKFRQFELSIRPKNCEVFCLTLIENFADIKKVRFRNDDKNQLM